jgi:eukaryotic-like serine/threonine-protein kinase
MSFLREEEIFAVAVEKPPAERTSFLDRACAGDPALRADLEALLQAHDHPDSLLEEGPCAAMVPAPRPMEGPGTRVGPYKLLQQIGDGGFGVVYMAEQQEPVRRMVALKIIKPGMDTKEVIARFESERQALALMDHPNIAKVLDGGATGVSGRPYFVMELVKGIPITQFCDNNYLPPTERLDLFIQICNALQHAHQKGVIHRDLKPSNVMVTLHDGRPVPKVIDFGVAKATSQRLTERTLFTAYGQMIGTPAYMSPEQAEMSGLDVDIRSDIYSLGVLLYELLTGTTPFESKRLREAGLVEMQRIIREEEPESVSTRLAKTKCDWWNAQTGTRKGKNGPSRGLFTPHRAFRTPRLLELDWIVMKSLDKDRERRYESASSFARDIHRYLSDEPVQACPPSVGYRLLKFARRNKRALATAALLAMMLLVAIVAVAGSIGWTVRDQQARRAQVASQLELLLDEVDQRQTEQKWAEALAVAKRAEALVAGGGGDELLQRKVQDVLANLNFVEQLEEIRLEREHQRGDERRAEWCDRAYATAFRDAEIDVDGLAEREAVRRLLLRSRQIVPLAAGLDDWASCRKPEDGKVLSAIAQQIDPDPWRRRVRDAMVKNDPEALAGLAIDSNLIRQPPATLYLLGRTLCISGKLQQGIGVLRQAHRQYPSDFWINIELGGRVAMLGPDHHGEALGFCHAAAALRPASAAAWHRVGFAHWTKGDRDEAIACFRKAIDLNPSYAYSYNELGIVLSEQNKLDEAAASFLKVTEVNPNHAYAYANLGRVLRMQNKLNDAAASFGKAIELSPGFANAHFGLGIVREEQKELDQAIACYWKAVELSPKLSSAETRLRDAIRGQSNRDTTIALLRAAAEANPQNALAHFYLGNALWYQGRPEESLEPFSRAAALEPSDVRFHDSLANNLSRLNRLDEAAASNEQALALLPGNVVLLYKLAGVFERQHRLAEAIMVWKQIVQLNPQHVQARARLAWNLATSADMKLRDPHEALVHAKEVAELQPGNANHWSNWGVALLRSRDARAALEKLEKAEQMSPGGDSAHAFFRAMAYWQVGEKDKARETYEKAVRWMDRNQPDNEELRRFRDEAEELLQIQEK